MKIINLLNLRRDLPPKHYSVKTVDDYQQIVTHACLVCGGLLCFVGVGFVGLSGWTKVVCSAVFVFGLVQQATCFATISSVDPGYVPLKEQQKNQVSLEVEEDNAIPERPAQKVLRQGDMEAVPEKQEEDGGKYCEHCEHVKPERAHHCKRCKRCVELYDHHCMYVLNCIGRNNVEYFFKYLVWSSVTSAISMVSSTYSLVSQRCGVFYLGGTLKQGKFLALFFIPPVFISMVAWFVPTVMLARATGRVLRGQTVIEEKEKKEGKSFMRRDWKSWMFRVQK